uniref:NADH dehydrogenase subunit 6 n=1 Tax=Panagrolaimus sp. JU765 TaxID=591449 RepID=A0AC34Q7K6_9BILA
MHAQLFFFKSVSSLIMLIHFLFLLLLYNSPSEAAPTSVPIYNHNLFQYNNSGNRNIYVFVIAIVIIILALLTICVGLCLRKTSDSSTKPIIKQNQPI